MSRDERWIVAFLRGINVGGRRISNADLCAAFGRIGLDDAQAFRAAGNVLFRSGDSEEWLVDRIETGLAKELGYEVRTLIRDGEELRAVAALEPFTPAQMEASKGKPQVCLFAEPLTDEQQQAVAAKSTEADQLVGGVREIHWLPAAGVSDSALDWDALAPDGAPQTMRTLGTIEGIVRKFPPGPH